jgi:hypothetical protein
MRRTYKRPPFLVDGDQSQRTWAPAHFPPVVLVGRCWRQMPVDGAARQREVGLWRGSIALPPACQAAHPAPPRCSYENGTTATSSGTLVWI